VYALILLALLWLPVRFLQALRCICACLREAQQKKQARCQEKKADRQAAAAHANLPVSSTSSHLVKL
jgi:hypothetical protein